MRYHSFTILNLFIATIVNTMQTMHELDHKQEEAAITKALFEEGHEIENEIQALREEMRQLKDLLKTSRSR